jgi:hypothetical protein
MQRYYFSHLIDKDTTERLSSVHWVTQLVNRRVTIHTGVWFGKKPMLFNNLLLALLPGRLLVTVCL